MDCTATQSVEQSQVWYETQLNVDPCPVLCDAVFIGGC